MCAPPPRCAWLSSGRGAPAVRCTAEARDCASGGPLETIVDGECGFLRDPDPQAGDVMVQLATTPKARARSRARSLALRIDCAHCPSRARRPSPPVCARHGARRARARAGEVLLPGVHGQAARHCGRGAGGCMMHEGSVLGVRSHASAAPRRAALRHAEPWPATASRCSSPTTPRDGALPSPATRCAGAVWRPPAQAAQDEPPARADDGAGAPCLPPCRARDRSLTKARSSGSSSGSSRAASSGRGSRSSCRATTRPSCAARPPRLRAPGPAEGHSRSCRRCGIAGHGDGHPRRAGARDVPSWRTSA